MSDMLKLKNKSVLERGAWFLRQVVLTTLMAGFISACDSAGTDCDLCVPVFSPVQQQIEIPYDGGNAILSVSKAYREERTFPKPSYTVNRPLEWFDTMKPVQDWADYMEYCDNLFGEIRYIDFSNGIAPPIGGVDGVYLMNGKYIIYFDRQTDGSFTAKVDWLKIRVTEYTLEVSADANDTGSPRVQTFNYANPDELGRISFYQSAME